MKEMKVATPKMKQMLKAVASKNWQEAAQARLEFAEALTGPIRQGVLKGDIVSDIFTRIPFEPGQATDFPLDFLSPGTEANFSAYTIPAMGKIPERHVDGDYINVYTYEVGSSIDFAMKYARDARWDVVGRAMQVLEASFVRKTNTDGWRVLLAAGAGRNLQVYDDTAGLGAGVFTKRLVELMKNIMRRNAGGNSTSVTRGKMTHLYLSPECMGDIRGWTLTEVDDVTRREIFLADEDGLSKIFGVTLRDIDELGVNQEFQTYFTDRLSGSFSDSNTELLVGLNLDPNKQDTFVMPVKQDVEIQDDPTYARSRRVSMYGVGEWGFASLDSRDVLLGSC